MNWELGGIHNFSRGFGVGLTGFGSLTNQDATLGPRLRLRYWITGTTTLDLGPGIAFGRGTPGFDGHIGITRGDRVGIALTLQALPASREELATRALFAGIRLGSHYGVIAGLAVPLVSLIALATCNCID